MPLKGAGAGAVASAFGGPKSAAIAKKTPGAAGVKSLDSMKNAQPELTVREELTNRARAEKLEETSPLSEAQKMMADQKQLLVWGADGTTRAPAAGISMLEREGVELKLAEDKELIIKNPEADLQAEQTQHAEQTQQFDEEYNREPVWYSNADPRIKYTSNVPPPSSTTEAELVGITIDVSMHGTSPYSHAYLYPAGADEDMNDIAIDDAFEHNERVKSPAARPPGSPVHSTGDESPRKLLFRSLILNEPAPPPPLAMTPKVTPKWQKMLEASYASNVFDDYVKTRDLFLAAEAEAFESGAWTAFEEFRDEKSKDSEIIFED